MPCKSLREYIRKLETAGELVRIKARVDTELEIAEIADREMKKPGGGKALLFENNGTDFPLLINAFGSEKRMAMALGASVPDEAAKDIEAMFRKLMKPKDGFGDKLKILHQLGKLSSWMPKKKREKAKCQEMIIDNPDLSILPILKCWPHDGGAFITLPLVHTVDPDTGARNLGMYRMQVFGKDKTGMHWHRHKTGAAHYRKYKKAGEKMPVAVALGGDPVYTYAATAPLPEQLDEYILAGFLRKKRVKLVRCRTQDIYVPADADIIIEGYVDPAEPLVNEGPFGDHTGFYSLADNYPVFHVTCITHRRDAVYPATIVGVPPMEDASMAKATEKLFLPVMRMSILPEIIDMHMPDAGVAHNIALIKIQKEYPGQAQKVMHSLWGAGQMMFNKIMIVAGEKIDIHDYLAFAKSSLKTFDPLRDVLISCGPLDVLDHAADVATFGGKLGLDFTNDDEDNAEPAPVDRSIIEKITGRPEVNDVSMEIIEEGLPVLLLSVNVDKVNDIHGFAKELCRDLPGGMFRLLLITDNSANVSDIFLSAWYIAGNIDPSRDCFIYSQDKNSILVIDGTNKKAAERFGRDWPNVVAMNAETIERVSKRWGEYFPGDKIPTSPSEKLIGLVRGNSAVYGKDS